MTTEALPTERVPIADLHLQERNARKHGKRNLDAIAGSLRKFGQRRALVVWRDTVIAGNGTLIAARDRLGWREIDITRCPPEWTEDDARAFALADNRTGELAEWDEEVLLEELGDLEAAGWDLAELGFDAKRAEQRDREAADAADKAPDEIPERVTPGDLWLLGDHRLICGDSTEPEVIGRLMEGARAELVHTDPPYGVSYVSTSGKHQAIANDDLTHDDLVRFLTRAFERAVEHTSRTAAFYVWHASATRDEYSWAMKAAGLEELEQIVWVKPTAVLGWAHYQWAHEPCFYAAKSGETPPWYGDRKQTTVWRIALSDGTHRAITVGPGLNVSDGDGNVLHLAPKAPKRKLRRMRLADGESIAITLPDATDTVWEVARDSKIDHPTQKPVDLAITAMVNSTEPGDGVLDLFGGSGSTLLGAEVVRRRCYTSELAPRYCDLIIARWERLTGCDAVRA